MHGHDGQNLLPDTYQTSVNQKQGLKPLMLQNKFVSLAGHAHQ